MRVLALACLFVLTILAPAQALTADAAVAQALDSGDVHALEQLIADMHRKSLLDKDARPLRALYARYIATTHPERRETIQAWARAYRQSAYAQTAVALLELIDQPLNDDRDAARKSTLAAAGEALRLGQDFAPALELWVTLSWSDDDDTPLDRTLSRLFAISPDHETILLVMRALSRHGVNRDRLLASLCETHASAIVDYDVELCMFDVVLRQYGLRNLREAALEALPGRTSPLLEGARALAALSQRDVSAADAVIAWHEAQLRMGVDVEAFNRRTHMIEYALERPGYAQTVSGALHAYIDARLVDDPYNVDLVLTRAHAVIVQPEPPADAVAAARDMWPAALRYGSQSPFVWEMGALLAMAGKHPSDAIAALPFLENLAAVANTTPYGAGRLFNMLHAAFVAAEARIEADQEVLAGANDASLIIETLSCPMLRAARVTDGICQGYTPGDSTCDPNRAAFKAVQNVLHRGRNGLCNDVARARLRGLAYTLSPMPEVAW
ncbi:MAG: hypothetical protein AAF748_09840 [Pseudomonadota bacterium]